MANRAAIDEWLQKTAALADVPMPGEVNISLATYNPEEQSCDAKMDLLLAGTTSRVGEQLEKVIGGQPAASALYLHERNFINTERRFISEKRTVAALVYLVGKGFDGVDRPPDSRFGRQIRSEVGSRMESSLWNLGIMRFNHANVLAILKDMRRSDIATRRPLGQERQLLLVNCSATRLVLGMEPYQIPSKTIDEIETYKALHDTKNNAE